MPTPKKEISFKNALLRAQSLCAGQEKCESDIRKKLYVWKLPASEHSKIIQDLIKNNFINHRRYAISFVKEKLNLNKWGKIKIEFTLKQKNIPSEDIRFALNEIPDNEYEKILESELVKKLKTIRDKDEYTIKSKLVRYATSKGFENGKVFDMVSAIVEKYN